jgi:hypothetical protein
MTPSTSVILSIGVLSLLSTCDGYQVPHSIAALLADAEEHEVRKNRFTLNTPEFFANASKFRALLEHAHLKSKKSDNPPVCLGGSNSDSFTKYDNHCSFTVTPSEYCCQVFSEQSCTDPSMSLTESVALVRDRTQGLGGAAEGFLYDGCMSTKCSSACSRSDGNAAACKQCAYTCQRVCLSNLQRLCMSRVCGQNWVSLSVHAMSNSKGRNFALHQQTDHEVQKRIRISSGDLKDIEKAEVIKTALSVLKSDSMVPMCTTSELVAADRSAGVFVDAAGSTYTEALIACTSTILNPDLVPHLLEDPTIVSDSRECNVVSTCERNHIQLSVDRAVVEVEKRFGN